MLWHIFPIAKCGGVLKYYYNDTKLLVYKSANYVKKYDGKWMRENVMFDIFQF